MAFSSGVFSRVHNWVTDKANSVAITASRMDAEHDGFATGLSTAICKDGQTTITADIPFNSQKITGLAKGTAATHAVNVEQVQDAELIYAADASNTDTYAITLSPAPAAYAAGQVFVIKCTNANTGASTLNVNSLGAKAIQSRGNALTGGEIPAAVPVVVVYDGTQFQLVSPPQTLPGGTITLETGTNANTGFGDGHYAATLSGALDNTAFGYQALAALTSGDYNTAIGSGALALTSTATHNTAVGQGAGATVTTGSYNTFVGQDADVAAGSGTLTKVVAVGASSEVSGNDATAVGYNTASVVQGVAIGSGASVTGSDGIAIGYGATAASDGIAIGSNAAASAGQLAIGSATEPVNTQTTVGSAGVASALPANPTGYLEIVINGTARVVPYYAKS